MCAHSFFKNTELFLEYVFVLLLGKIKYEVRSKFTSDYSLQLVTVMFICLDGNPFAEYRLVLVTVHFTYVTPLNPQEYKLSDAVNKWVIIQDFSPAHLVIGSILPGPTLYNSKQY